VIFRSLLLLPLLGALAAFGDSTAPLPSVSPEELEISIKRGVEFLKKNQNKDGSWGSPHNTKGLNIYAPVPGSHHAFRVAVTAMAIEALIETGATDRDPEALQALERSEEWLLAELPKVRRAVADAIYNVWAHAYGIQALVDMHRRAPANEERKQKIREVIDTQLDLLRRYESVDGGWGYYDFRVGSKRPASDSTSFTTATVLIAFHDAQQIGITIPEDLRKRAADSIQRQRKNDNSYAYGEYLKLRPMMGINRPAGSLGRSQACSLALKMWGDETISEESLIEWLDRLVARNGWLSIGRKRPVPHEAWFQVAGYFYYYGHYYAARCTEAIAPEPAAKYRQHLASILLPLQEKDGSWWDFPFYNYHQQYGTAFALMTLARCRQPVL
jgi:hypothetical protein